jgi:hypothetical protein
MLCASQWPRSLHTRCGRPPASSSRILFWCSDVSNNQLQELPKCVGNMTFRLLYEPSLPADVPDSQLTIRSSKASCRSADNNRLKVLVPKLPSSLLYLCAPSLGPTSSHGRIPPINFAACNSSANNNSLEELPDLTNLKNLQRLSAAYLLLMRSVVLERLSCGCCRCKLALWFASGRRGETGSPNFNRWSTTNRIRALLCPSSRCYEYCKFWQCQCQRALAFTRAALWYLDQGPAWEQDFTFFARPVFAAVAATRRSVSLATFVRCALLYKHRYRHRAFRLLGGNKLSCEGTDGVNGSNFVVCHEAEDTLVINSRVKTMYAPTICSHPRPRIIIRPRLHQSALCLQ